MSVIVAGVIAGVGVAGSTVLGGIQGAKQKKAFEEAQAAAAQIKKEQDALLLKQKNLKNKQTNIQYERGQDTLSTQTTSAQTSLTLGGYQAETKSGLETSSADTSKAMSTNELMNKFTNMQQDLVATKELEKEQTQFSFQSGQISNIREEAMATAGMDEGGWGMGAATGFMSSIGSAGSVAAASDKRLKENVDYIGDSSSGIRMYEFNYLGGNTRYRGVVADDLIDSHPDIIGKNNDGYYTVDYSKIDVDLEIVEGD